MHRGASIAVVVLVAASGAWGQDCTVETSQPAPENPAVETYVAYLPASPSPEGPLTSAGTITTNLGAFSIQINAGAGLSANPPAVAAFQRAAAQWEQRISDPITVTVDADLADLGSTTIIGQATTVLLTGPYDVIRDPMVADAADEPDDGIVASVPSAATFSASLPTGFSFNGNLIAAKSTLKAMGFTGLDTQFGARDSTITFNTGFAFDYDNSDGVTPGTMDFETVAAHELGHALGFISAVDVIDYYVDQGATAEIAPYVLDLFRFENDGTADPQTSAEFEAYPRSLVPNNDEVTDFVQTVWSELTTAEYRMSTGAYTGDGRQASHWKDNNLTGEILGIMDPTLAYGQINTVSAVDLRALDVIGYEIVPEPATALLVGVGLVGLLARRRRQRPA